VFCKTSTVVVVEGRNTVIAKRNTEADCRSDFSRGELVRKFGRCLPVMWLRRGKPYKSQGKVCCVDLVPEGRLRIAHRFSGGWEGPEKCKSRQGRLAFRRSCDHLPGCEAAQGQYHECPKYKA
jgi:hypothetical protein